MDGLALAFSSGWASGVNAYLVVLVLGIADRLGDLEQIPDALGRWDVLIVAGVLYAMEFVADKVPYIDSTWDAISTAIRPTVGAVIGVLLAGDASSLDQAVLAVVGGGTALLSHLGQGRAAGWRSTPPPSPCPTSSRASPRTSPSSASCGSRSTTRGPPPRSPGCCSPPGWSSSTWWRG